MISFHDDDIFGFCVCECRKYHSSLKTWPWNVKERTNTSVVPMFSGNGEKDPFVISPPPLVSI